VLAISSKSILGASKLRENTFVDLFSGIGGFHLACHLATRKFPSAQRSKCVFACEINEKARLTYERNFKKLEPDLFSGSSFARDITDVVPSTIPNFKLLCAGFPCQPFSQAGKKMGFEDVRGSMFGYISEIIAQKFPEAIFLENVNFLKNHNSGQTFKTIRRVLEDELQYKMEYFDVKASDHGLPQHRRRIFMIGFREPNINFSPPKKRELKINMSDVFGGECSREIGFTLRLGGKKSPLTDRRNWDGYIVDGAERRLSPNEAKMMQGFPSSFKFPVSDYEAMRQLGNSVAVNAVQDYVSQIFLALNATAAI
jgi:DNA (cytosine-5)-methyltransferase 1